MPIIQVIIDDSTSKVITGTYEFDRDNGGTLLIPSGTSFPGTPAAKELFWRTDEAKLYRRSDANDAWVAVTAVLAAHASSHQPGGGDAMAVDTAAGTGSLRTLGTSATSACAGSDSRLSDARTPTAHAASHQSGGGDAVKLDDLATPDDNTDLNASTARHGLLRKLSNLATEFLNGQGSWAVPAGGSGVDPFATCEFWDHFVAVLLDDQWATATTGTGSSVTVLAAQGGQVQIRAGNAATRSAELLLGSGAWVAVSHNPKLKVRGKYDGTANGAVWIELLWIDASNYVVAEADAAGNWRLRTMSGGVETDTDTGVALGTGWRVVEVVATAADVKLYLDGTLAATNTTNIPTAAGRPSIYVIASGTGGTKNYVVDVVRYNCDLEA